MEPRKQSVVQLIEALHNNETRERALLLLLSWYTRRRHVSRKWATHEELAPLLWHSIGTISILLQEIISVYHSLHSPTLTENGPSRVCNALVLFHMLPLWQELRYNDIMFYQCIATNPSTKKLFIEAKIPLYLYPFLNNKNQQRPHEFLKLASLGVISALAKVDDQDVFDFLLESEVFPCCLCCMEVGGELSKTVATYIVYKILVNEAGSRYCCTVVERFFVLARVLGNMVGKLAEDGKLAEVSSKRLLKHISWCYHRLSESPRTCDGLRCCLPVMLSDAAVMDIFHDDPSATQCLQQLFHNVSTRTSRVEPIKQLMKPLD